MDLVTHNISHVNLMDELQRLKENYWRVGQLRHTVYTGLDLIVGNRKTDT